MGFGKDGDVTVIKHNLTELFKPIVVDAIRELVPVYNRIAASATVLANMHLRSLLYAGARSEQLAPFFDANHLRHYFQAVTKGKCNALQAQLQQLYLSLRDDTDTSPPLERRPRGNSQVGLYLCRGLAATAATNIWYHLKARVKSLVNKTFFFERQEWLALSAEQRREHKRILELVRFDVLRLSDTDYTSPIFYVMGDTRHSLRLWIICLRAAMRISRISSASVASLPGVRMSDDESLPGMIYYAKARPHEFVWATKVLSERNIALGGNGFSLFPLRRSAVPKHIHLDCDIVAVLDPDMSVQQADKLAVEQVGSARKRKSTDETEEQTRERNRLSKAIVAVKKKIIFESAMLPKAFRHLTRMRESGNTFDFAVKTDGYDASAQMIRKSNVSASASATVPPPSVFPPRIRNGEYSLGEFRDKYGDHYFSSQAEKDAVEQPVPDPSAAELALTQRTTAFWDAFRRGGEQRYLLYSTKNIPAEGRGDYFDKKTSVVTTLEEVLEAAERIVANPVVEGALHCCSSGCTKLHRGVLPAFGSGGPICSSCETAEAVEAMQVDPPAIKKNVMAVVAIDPGKREIISAVDVDNPDNKYTLRKSHQDHVTGSIRHRKDMAARMEVWDREHEKKVKEVEEDMAAASSNAVPLESFRAYASKLVFSLSSRCPFYEQPIFRTRSRKRKLRKQSLYATVVNRLRNLPDKTGPVVLSYGSWGARTSGLRFKGTPPTIGVGFMHYLSRFFPVVVTPEHYTSSICLACDDKVVRCRHAEEARENCRTETGHLKQIRGLRFCEHCNIHFNRDHLGARNIGRNFCNLYNGRPPIRRHSQEELDRLRIQSSI